MTEIYSHGSTYILDSLNMGFWNFFFFLPFFLGIIVIFFLSPFEPLLVLDGQFFLGYSSCWRATSCKTLLGSAVFGFGQLECGVFPWLMVSQLCSL